MRGVFLEELLTRLRDTGAAAYGLRAATRGNGANSAPMSATTVLYPGDLIMTGTPSGVGFSRTPPRYLQPGDVLSFNNGTNTETFADHDTISATYLNGVLSLSGTARAT